MDLQSFGFIGSFNYISGAERRRLRFSFRKTLQPLLMRLWCDRVFHAWSKNDRVVGTCRFKGL
jgi:hypothetical protein